MSPSKPLTTMTSLLASTEASTSRVEQIRRNIDDDWQVLKSIYDLLLNGKAFGLNAEEMSNDKILHFVQPHELRKLIDLRLDEHETHTTEEIREICKKIIKYSVKTSHGRFHNQLFGQMDPFGLAGSWITEALNTSAYTFEVAPVFSLIETEIIRKVCDLVGYGPGEGDGIFSPGGSLSNMYGLVLARYKRYPQCKSTGMFGIKRPLVLFTSEESHYSFKKAAHWLGFGADNCVIVKTNERGQMLIDDLKSQILRCQSEGREPFFVNATAGTTVLGAFDDFNGIADVCEKFGIWMHVDGCLGISSLLSYENRHLVDGLARADSFAWNPHKTLGAPLQCALFITREHELLSHCNSIEVNYLFQQDKYYDVSYDTGNKSIQCGRKIDAFKFWLMLKARGYGSYGCLLDHSISMAKRFVEKLQARGADRYRLVLDEFEYTNVCFWYIPKALRDVEQDTPEWRARLYTVAPKIKERMVKRGSLMIGYAPLLYRGLGNFFRIVFTIFPVLDDAELDFMLDEIERCGEECTY